jgi:DNA mismatch repair protein MutS
MQTPAMKQFSRFKAAHPGCLLLFRMGDFYETFGEDAVAASRAIGLTLTQRSAGLPMAGVPYHQIDTYLRKLIAAGFRVAICDQVQDPKDAKGLVERAVTRVITPGTLLEENLLDAETPNVLAAVAVLETADSSSGGSAQAALAMAELSTGQFHVMTLPLAQLADELARRRVTELIYPEIIRTGGGGAPTSAARAANADSATSPIPARLRPIVTALGISTTPVAPWHFRPTEALEALTNQFGVKTLAGFGLADHDPVIGPAGALVRYLSTTQLPSGDVSPAGTGGVNRAGAALSHLRPPRVATPTDHLVIDAVSLRALEIDRTLRGSARAGGGSAGSDTEGSLLGVFQTAGGQHLCRTLIGRRLLREWLVRPLRQREAIIARQRCVMALVEDRRFAGQLGEALEPIQDVARIAARVALRRATPRDVVALGRSVAQARALAELLATTPAFAPQRADLASAAEALGPLADEVARLCVATPPPHLREGGLIRDGVDAELDEYRQLQTHAAEWMAQYQARLISEHDLPNLKVGYNKIFGYFIELPKAQAQRAPALFTRRQTLTNAERYITPELKTFEDKATHAATRALAREQAMFDALCDQAGAKLGPINAFADAAASCDVLLALADKATARRWVCPEIVAEPVLQITQGRHPVLEQRLEADFVPNDLTLAGGQAPLALITGPNMAGKSTFIRQTALLTLLAHVGSFVPAQAATIGLCDRIFTRVGADDALFAGQSTFMVEMTETANILHHATAHSLVVLDEIGRGTSTLDGLSLAWAIAETLAAGTTEAGGGGGAGSGAAKGAALRGPRTLFATHYHELTRLAELLPGRVQNLHVAVREWQDQVIFLHRIEPGRAERSFGIHVARLAGIPPQTVARAKTLLDELSVEHAGTGGAGGSAGRTPSSRPARPAAPAQRSLFGPDEGHAEPEPTAAPPHPVLEALREIKLDSITPLQAFDHLRRAVELAQDAPSVSSPHPSPAPPAGGRGKRR